MRVSRRKPRHAKNFFLTENCCETQIWAILELYELTMMAVLVFKGSGVFWLVFQRLGLVFCLTFWQPWLEPGEDPCKEEPGEYPCKEVPEYSSSKM